MNASRSKKLLGLFSWFSLVRLPNLLLLACAEYLAAGYIFSPNTPILDLLMDIKLFGLIIASLCCVVAGYIINDYYDQNKDIINKPLKSRIDNRIDRQSKGMVYLLLNFIALVMASYVSYRATLFFVMYIFGIWMYSYLIKRLLLFGNIISALLAITPFFAIFLYYKNIQVIIFAHAFFLFLLLFLRELIKDLENLHGDYTMNYHTIPVVYGQQIAKKFILIIFGLTLVTGIIIPWLYDVGQMRYYFYLCSLLLLVLMVLLPRVNHKKHFFLLHNMIRLIIGLGVASILLIDFNKVIN